MRSSAQLSSGLAQPGPASRTQDSRTRTPGLLYPGLQDSRTHAILTKSFFTLSDFVSQIPGYCGTNLFFCWNDAHARAVLQHSQIAHTADVSRGILLGLGISLHLQSDSFITCDRVRVPLCLEGVIVYVSSSPAQHCINAEESGI